MSQDQHQDQHDEVTTEPTVEPLPMPDEAHNQSATVAESATVADPEVDSPVVEILPPVGETAETLPPNVTVDRTHVSVGLGGLSVQRTRMSTEGQPPDDPASVFHPELSAAVTDAGLAEAGLAEAEASLIPSEPSDSTLANIQLFTRFLVGAAIYGVDELMERLQKYDADIQENPDEYDLTDHLLARFDETEESIEAIVRYWAIGTLLWGQRSALNLTYRSFQISINASQALLQTADKGTDNVLLRPIRRPIERLVGSLSDSARARIEEGRQVEVRDRALAQQALDDIVGDVIDYISENPELAELISEQSLGLASNIMDTGRQVGATADSVVEKMVRKIFRRTPRPEVETSPLLGKPQDMYDPTAEAYYVERKSKKEAD